MPEGTEDDFDAKYTFDASITSTEYDDGRLETFGPDLEQAKALAEANSKRLWTAIECDGEQFYVAGFHHVNRLYYVVTVEEWTHDDESYLLDSFSDEEAA